MTMQTLTWYFQRLRSMSPGEVVWRIRGKIIDLIDGYKISSGISSSLEQVISYEERNKWGPPFRVSDLKVGEWKGNDASPEEQKWCSELIRQADNIVDHKLSYFHLHEHYHGHPIQWNKDHGNNITAPIRLTAKIDYRDLNEVGDCKLVWEPNRHQHLVVLARAYRASGDKKYALSIKEQLESWLIQCPFGYGMNWRSPMELSIRLINWVWAIDLTLESGIFSEHLQEQLFYSVFLHLREVNKKYSRGSSANNHLIGEAGGVFIASSYFPEISKASQWQHESYTILCREIELQTFTDGCNKELALEYQFFVLQIFLFCGLVGKWCGKEFPSGYWHNIEKQLDFLGHLQEGGGDPVFYGDADDGYILNLGDSHIDPKPLLAAGALIFNNRKFALWAQKYCQTLRWLFGNAGGENLASLSANHGDYPLTSHSFQECGFYLLQSGAWRSPQRISVLFDCGPLGFGTIAAHGHADALSFTLKAFGEDILIDPGTYDYFTYPQWRNYFRSTLAHNTVEVDGENQSEILGLFLWGKRASARCLEWQPHEKSCRVTGEHDGYCRLKDPVTHRRTLSLDEQERALYITDELVAKKDHSIRLAFHCAPTCEIARLESGVFRIIGRKGIVTMNLDQKLTAEVYRGELNPPYGWVSRGYHKKNPCSVIVAQADICGSAIFSCSLNFDSVPQ